MPLLPRARGFHVLRAEVLLSKTKVEVQQREGRKCPIVREPRKYEGRVELNGSVHPTTGFSIRVNPAAGC